MNGRLRRGWTGLRERQLEGQQQQYNYRVKRLTIKSSNYIIELYLDPPWNTHWQSAIFDLLIYKGLRSTRTIACNAEEIVGVCTEGRCRICDFGFWIAGPKETKKKDFNAETGRNARGAQRRNGGRAGQEQEQKRKKRSQRQEDGGRKIRRESGRIKKSLTTDYTDFTDKRTSFLLAALPRSTSAV
jgi:hypothetical protein